MRDEYGVLKKLAAPEFARIQETFYLNVHLITRKRPDAFCFRCCK